MNAPAKRAAFSLLEVVIAAGVFAVAVTATLALLPSLTRHAAGSADAFVAQGLPDKLRVELQRLAADGFIELAAAVPAMADPLADGLALVATRDGSRLHSLAYLPPSSSHLIPAGDQYFHVEVWRFHQGSLRHDAAVPVLPLYVRVSWPGRSLDGNTVTALADRSQLTFTLALNR